MWLGQIGCLVVQQWRSQWGSGGSIASTPPPPIHRTATPLPKILATPLALGLRLRHVLPTGRVFIYRDIIIVVAKLIKPLAIAFIFVKKN